MDPDNKRLRFPCECVSGGPGGYSEPWADIARHKLLPNGTKEEILNLMAREPKTISQLAQALNLSAPSVYSHINDLVKSELIRESEEWEKRHPTERYYEPNFPVFKVEDCQEFLGICEEMAAEMAGIFSRKEADLRAAFAKTNLASDGWEFNDITQCVFANMHRTARKVLEEKEILKAPEKHANGSNWVYWAEEPFEK
jgi:DNA-binding transcriptional ArsR family regulator